ncbi:MAG: Hpt domain-containing protein [Syntrophobacteraceae bacterium]|jgi:HPt (histidine-containing phosphotransfer) domain-containing protein|nr:Hpt domain-containing protein [Syntrophobacteraceae bacterium]
MSQDQGTGGEPRNGSGLEPSLLDQDKLQGIRALDPDGKAGLLRRVIQAFIDKTPGLLQQISSALEAGDVEGVFRGAHSLKSSSAMVGAMRLSETCRQLEAVGRRGSLDGAVELFASIQADFHRVSLALAQWTEG